MLGYIFVTCLLIVLACSLFISALTLALLDATEQISRVELIIVSAVVILGTVYGVHHLLTH